MSDENTFVKLLSVEDEIEPNDLLAKLRDKGLKLVGELDNVEDDEDVSGKIDLATE